MPGRCAVLVGSVSAAIVLLALLVRPAAAGPPFVADDPEPTDTGHFEIYTFANGTNTRAGTAGEAGIDFNYGAAPDLQLTATLPAGYADAMQGGTHVGLGNVELAAKYRFLHQDTFGLDVSVFPRVFLPSGSEIVGDNHASLLLPIWVQKDFGKGWSAFGGGGCTFNEIRAANFCQAGAVVAYQLLPKLQIGAELFHQTADSQGTPASTSLGVGWRYDLTDNYHLLGYVRRGIENADETDRYSWYASVLFTF
ncbi:transporter [Bradyrhizobium genosp. L]|uniref:transporter n=1 Tax=Bradyrhizobium genosp. L TaxID=83637 RepID=UPI0018A2B82C|nr:transporter [Bradyrhizobium genosp. L]QPF85810.1 transporter [Bradyrhizobium genosp. L]